jgi:hypothetical protein
MTEENEDGSEQICTLSMPIFSVSKEKKRVYEAKISPYTP